MTYKDPAKHLEYVRRWHKAHPEKMREYKHRWARAHPDKVREKGRGAGIRWAEWAKANPRKKSEADRRWKEAHSDEVREFKRRYEASEKGREAHSRWKKANPEKVREISTRWARANPEKIRNARLRRYKAHPEKHREAVHRWVHAHHEWKLARDRRRGKQHSLRWLLRKVPGLEPICAIGGGLATQADHIIPRSSGGTNKAVNLRPICRFHNRMRGPTWWHPIPLTDEELRAFPCGSR